MNKMNVFNANENNEINSLLSQIRTCKKHYDMFLPLSKREHEILEKRFNEEEIFTSNHIEGNSYTLSETRYLLDTGNAISGKKLKDGIEIINISKGIKFINEKHGELTEGFVKHLHETVTKNTLESDLEEREYKQVRNYIGDIQTSSVKHTPIHMKKLLNRINNELNNKAIGDINVIKIAVDFKYNFLAIHPFVDGNGRTVRLLFNYILKEYGFIPVSILPEDKEDYYKALQNSNKDDFRELLKFMCNVIIKTYQRRLDWLNGE